MECDCSGAQVIKTTVTGDCDSHFKVEIYNTSSLESDDNFHSGSMLNISVIRRQRTIPSLMFTLENILIVQRLNHLLSHLSVVADSRLTLWNYLTLKKKSFCHPIWGVLVTVCCLSTKILTLFSSKLRITKLFSGMIWICKKKIESKCEIHVSKIFQLKYHLSHGKDESSKYALLPTCDISVGSSVQLVFGRHRLESCQSLIFSRLFPEIVQLATHQQR